MPQFGHGYITLDNYSFPPSPADQAAALEKLRPVIGFALNGSLYALRNGMVARFDADTLAQTQVHDLLPDAAKIPGAEQIPDQVRAAMSSERTMRSATPLVFPLGNELAVFIPGAGYIRLDSATLEEKASLGQERYPFAIQANNTLPAEGRLYVVSSNALLVLNIADGSVLGTMALPKGMVESLFP